MVPSPIPDDMGRGTAAGVTAAAAGVAEATTGAVSNGLAAATGALNRAMTQLQTMELTQAMEGVQKALRNLAGQSAATVAPHAHLAQHLPEVLV